jgi:UDP-N-acetylglucosamine--N-acetylmuramyl-(pentapeptide) pyrophosphoryl-undecaprenol N-acetylglucosamine transferase
VLFVLGGSQGARAINHAMTGALPLLAGWGKALRILHQTGPRDLDWVREAYRACPIPHEVVPFIDDMAAAFACARIVVSRSGASAANEIVTARRASILIPIPRTSGDHQFGNARRVADAGAGIVLEQSAATGERLAAELIALLNDPARLDAMEAACDRLFPGDAAAAIADSCLRLIGRSAAR